MPILVQCPYCGKGTARVPDSAIGLPVVCRFCSSCFTIAPPSLLPATAKAPELVESVPRAVAVGDAAKSAQEAFTTLIASPTAPTEPATSVGTVVAVPISQPTESSPVPALIAISLGGIGLAVSQIPYGRFGTAALGAIGLVFAIASLLAANRRRWLSELAAGLNGVALLLSIALPEWLGLSSWRPVRLPEEARMVRAVSPKDGLAEPADWVDVTKAAWQRDDVRVGVSSFTIAPEEIVGPKDKHQWTKEACVQVRIRVENVGVSRTIHVHGWAESPSPDGPRLTDAAGKVLPQKVFPEGWSPVERSKTDKILFPGRALEQLLFFESPGKTAGDLRLELPAAAFGGTETVRLLLSR